MGFADLHIHSMHSPDATTTVRAVLKQADDVGLDVVAITDHDTITGSLEARELASQYNVEVVTGAEVTTSEGHLVALYVDQLPPAGMSLDETLLWIGYHGGIAIAPHPFNQLPNSLDVQSVIGVFNRPRSKGVLKGIEVYNMATRDFNDTVEKLSAFLPLAKTAASDAHVYWAIGVGRTQFSGSSADDLRVALEKATTIPVPFEGEMPASPLLSWLRRIFLRRLGYVSDVTSASSPINTQKFDRSALLKAMKKMKK
jgi:predicted metal-dependent phosphoesterase TrpH